MITLNLDGGIELEVLKDDADTVALVLGDQDGAQITARLSRRDMHLLAQALYAHMEYDTCGNTPKPPEKECPVCHRSPDRCKCP